MPETFTESQLLPAVTCVANVAYGQGLTVTSNGDIWVGALEDDTVRVFTTGSPPSLGALKQASATRCSQSG